MDTCFFEWIRRGMKVKRFHTEQLLTEDTVGHHSANVAALILWLYRPARPTVTLLEAAILHDVAEGSVGDSPAQAKWRHKPLHEALHYLENVAWQDHNELPPHHVISSDEEIVLRFADSMDCAIKCAEGS